MLARGIDEKRLLQAVASRCGSEILPAVRVIPLRCLTEPNVHVQIEAIAGRDSSIKRIAIGPEPSWKWGDGVNFSDCIRYGDLVFIASQMSIDAAEASVDRGDIVRQAQDTIGNIQTVLERLGAGLDDVVKLNTFYVGIGATEDWKNAAKVRANAFRKPGPGATGVPVPGPYPNGQLLRQDALAIHSTSGGRVPRSLSWPLGSWDWPIPVTFQQGIKVGSMIILGGQVAHDEARQVLGPGDLTRQARECMECIQRILAGFGASTENLVMLTFLYQTDGRKSDLAKVIEGIAPFFSSVLPPLTAVSLSALGAEDLMIEIEGIASL